MGRQIERLAEHLADAGGCVHQEERGHEGRRNRNQQRKRSREQRSDNRRQCAVTVGNRIPIRADDESGAELPPGRKGSPAELDQERRQQHGHQKRTSGRGDPEQPIHAGRGDWNDPNHDTAPT